MLRPPLTRERVLRAVVASADAAGIDAISMRKLARALGVVPMALYKHVADKDALIDGMIDVVVAEIDPPISGASWKTAIRQRVLSARQMLLSHPWASRVIESRDQPTPAVLAYMDSMIGIFRDAGFSTDLTHHVMHAMGSRLLGFTQELFDDSASANAPPDPAMLEQMASHYPNIVQMVVAISHDPNSVVGSGCDDQVEFEFALDLMLDGIERIARADRARARTHERL
jgi:AcrR family transcriptional regulator